MQNSTLRLAWANKKAQKHAIYPIFIPFAGCERRCIFCAQHVQTGQRPLTSTAQTLAQAEEHLQECHQIKSAHSSNDNVNTYSTPMELAFYGGTFTALPAEDFALCLNFTQKHLQAGCITHARCSTRPDAINKEKLTALKNAGFTCVELGVQSFNNTALHAAQRHYQEQCIQKACALVHDFQFTLGIQLMPGMPGVTEQIFLQDTQKALAAGADFLRMYPCQVIAGTQLEMQWKEGLFQPWTLTQTISALSKGWLLAQKARTPVIRMGLAPEKSLQEHIVAGPRHAALGNIVQAQALYSYIFEEISSYPNLKIKKILLPRACQGYVWGHGQSLIQSWASLGIKKENLFWHEAEHIEIIY